MERKAAASNDLTQRLLQAEANRPADKAQQIALKLIATESSASIQLTPPSRNGIVSTGSAASQSVSARKPCARHLAVTISVARRRVRNSRPSVPSRRSRLRQSA